MKSDAKKEILLTILESLFYDDSCEIEGENCITFYHFLLDTLERELFEIPIEQDADISLRLIRRRFIFLEQQKYLRISKRLRCTYG